MRESLEQLRGAALGEAGGSVDDEVLAQAPLVDPIAEHGERDPRIAPDVRELALVGEGADDDLAVLESDPGRADVRPTFAVERHDVATAADSMSASASSDRRSAMAPSVDR